MKEWKSKLNITCFLFLSLLIILPGNSHGQNSGSDFTYSVISDPFEIGYKEKYQLTVAHPYSFDLKTIQKCMWSLAYQERAISWSQKRRIFNKTSIEQLGPLIVRQFAKSGPNHRVVFKIAQPSGKIIFQGDTFLTPKGIHWRFTKINSSMRKIGDFSIMGDSWKLVPAKGQTYKTIEEHKGLVQEITNWMVFTKIRPDPSRALELPIPGEPDENKEESSATALSIKKRLLRLEELKREGLINQEEYQKKRLEILDKL